MTSLLWAKQRGTLFTNKKKAALIKHLFALGKVRGQKVKIGNYFEM